MGGGGGGGGGGSGGGLYQDAPHVKEFTAASFPSGDRTIAAVEFYAPWCGEKRPPTPQRRVYQRSTFCLCFLIRS